MKIGLIILGIYFIIQPILFTFSNRHIKSDNLTILSALSLWLIPVGIFMIIGQFVGVN